MLRVPETYKQQMSDSDMVFRSITCGNFENYDVAKQCVVRFYIPDMTISRAGISHALKRLEEHYK